MTGQSGAARREDVTATQRDAVLVDRSDLRVLIEDWDRLAAAGLGDGSEMARDDYEAVFHAYMRLFEAVSVDG